MTLHPKVEPKYKFKDGWFIRDHQKIVQPMFFFDKGRNDGKGEGNMKFKGIKKILEERGMWNGQKLDLLITLFSSELLCKTHTCNGTRLFRTKNINCRNC